MNAQPEAEPAALSTRVAHSPESVDGGWKIATLHLRDALLAIYAERLSARRCKRIAMRALRDLAEAEALLEEDESDRVVIDGGGTEPEKSLPPALGGP